MTSDGPWRVNAPHVIAESVDGEVLVVNLLTGAYFSSDGVGDVAWALLSGGATLPAITAAIAGHYGLPEADIARDLAPWFARVLEDGLVAEGAPPAGASPAPLTFPPVYAPPVMTRYTDMEDLLLLDPVHEVDEVGWPVAGNPA